MLVIAQVVGELTVERGLQQPLGQLLEHPALTGQLQSTSLRPVHQLRDQLLISPSKPGVSAPAYASSVSTPDIISVIGVTS